MANAFPNCTVHAVDCDQVFAIIINIVNINLGIILMIIKMIRLLGFNREGKAEHKGGGPKKNVPFSSLLLLRGPATPPPLSSPVGN